MPQHRPTQQLEPSQAAAQAHTSVLPHVTQQRPSGGSAHAGWTLAKTTKVTLATNKKRDEKDPHLAPLQYFEALPHL